MLSGTSMAAPHISGIAALLKHAHREWSNAAIRSAILTTASQLDNRGQYIRASQPSSNSSAPNGLSTPFDYGSGFVNATAAMDPGLIFDVGRASELQYFLNCYPNNSFPELLFKWQN
jgi:subtilisin family serine protease